MKAFSLLVGIVNFLVPSFAEAVPFNLGKSVDLHGKIVEWMWRGDMEYEQEGSFEPTFGSFERSHYLIVIEAADADPALLRRISGMVGSAPIRHSIMDRKLAPTEVLLMIRSMRLKELTDGATLHLRNYSLSGDERMTNPSHDSLSINGKRPTLAGPLFSPDPRPMKPKRARSGK